jgi:hypothetical protein
MDDSVERLIEADIFAEKTESHCHTSDNLRRNREKRKLQQEYLSFLSDEIGRD